MYSEILRSGIEYKLNESLKSYTSYGTGGKADVMLFPKNKDEFFESVKLSSELDSFILGNGSNVLVSDKGYNGVVINTLYLNKINIRGNVITAECGAKLSKVIQEATLNSLSGLEFMVGIPATIGGATAMNAGCFNKEISEYVSYVEATSGVYNAEDCDFGYRSSKFSAKNAIYLICLVLKSGEYDIIEEKLNKFSKLRSSKQPKGRSCGSVFKNEDYYAGKLIDEQLLKGYSIGGARISEQHANFILVDKGGTSSDIYRLIQKVKNTVKENTGISLKEELVYLGDFNETDV